MLLEVRVWLTVAVLLCVLLQRPSFNWRQDEPLDQLHDRPAQRSSCQTHPSEYRDSGGIDRHRGRSTSPQSGSHGHRLFHQCSGFQLRPTRCPRVPEAASTVQCA
ncbi:hypothetical protein ECANGB1_2655 [Enterospora canceri]|uniref:Secreted protein n=1 Tax=Enterospora canceri TaxID=1081671 RepID=A0A1Y1S6I2_9MICR|nr:hypothetical protein ECANGB1_2655 [Enterospora canceri]